MVRSGSKELTVNILTADTNVTIVNIGVTPLVDKES